VKNLTAGPGIDYSSVNFVAEADHLGFIKRTDPERGDILITKDGTLGVVRAVRTDKVFSIFVSLALVKPVDTKMTDYMELAFTSPQLQQQMVGVGSGLQHIHLTDLRKDMIPVAPEAEQLEIVRRVHQDLALIDAVESAVAAAFSGLRELDQSILAKAFRGELVAQDPSDEPASALLDRIRAERAAAPQQKRGSRRNGVTKMPSRRKSQRRPVVEVLTEQKAPLTPEQLFQMAGFALEQVDEFYAEIKAAVEAGRIKQDSHKRLAMAR
jgi:type I restriction enzyme, S subunit